MSTIINLAQNFVGSNNLNLLQPLGQFGTRLHGGKDAASPRYIFTMLRYVFYTLFILGKRYTWQMNDFTSCQMWSTLEWLSGLKFSLD